MIRVRHIGGVATLVLGEEGGLGIKGKQNGRRMLHGIHDECLKVRRQSAHAGSRQGFTIAKQRKQRGHNKFMGRSLA